MAVKDHSLDDKIKNAAMKEFTEYGFRTASLHKIADRAGVTTGALYTRYKNKDALFASLLEELFTVFRDYAEPAAERYRKAEESHNVDDFLAAMKFESQVYMKLLFDRYEECVLFFCKSDGSSVAESIRSLICHKVSSTVEFFDGGKFPHLPSAFECRVRKGKSGGLHGNCSGFFGDWMEGFI